MQINEEWGKYFSFLAESAKYFFLSNVGLGRGGRRRRWLQNFLSERRHKGVGTSGWLRFIETIDGVGMAPQTPRTTH